jgi:hypothetical protein
MEKTDTAGADCTGARSRQLDRRKRIQERVLYIVRKPSLIGGAIHQVAHDFPGFFQQSVLQVIDRPGTNPVINADRLRLADAMDAIRGLIMVARRVLVQTLEKTGALP